MYIIRIFAHAFYTYCIQYILRVYFRWEDIRGKYHIKYMHIICIFRYAFYAWVKPCIIHVYFMSDSRRGRAHIFSTYNIRGFSLVPRTM